MKTQLIRSLLLCIVFSAQAHAAKEILLQHAPDADAPVIAKITATDKVILDAAPAPRNAELGWRQLALPTPFEGYVPVATIDKSMAIHEGTPVHYLPTANSAEITNVEPGDRYEVVRAKDDWATVRFYKEITGYFLATEEAKPLGTLHSPARRSLDEGGSSAPITSPPIPLFATDPLPEPVAIPAPPKRINPDEPIAQIDPDSLPPENVVWKPAATSPELSSEATNKPPRGLGSLNRGESRYDDLVVSPANTQARETTPGLGPAKAPRLLTGTLIREIASDGPAYPIRLTSPEGRLIAYVDFSSIFISDLSPYLNQKVYLRGEVHPLPENSSQLVILAQDIRLAE